MKVYQGKSVCGGIAIGRIRVYHRAEFSNERAASVEGCRAQEIIVPPEGSEVRETTAVWEKNVQKAASVEGCRAQEVIVPPEGCDAREATGVWEKSRIARARAGAGKRLEELYEKCKQETGPEEAEIFQAYQLILEDGEFLKAVEMAIDRGKKAEGAVMEARESLVEHFEGLEDEYMRGRATDVGSVADLLLEMLAGRNGFTWNLEEASIVLAEDLTPQETVQMEPEKVLAFVTLRGSVYSHAAILARTMGIPALAGLEWLKNEKLEMVPRESAACGLEGMEKGESGAVKERPEGGDPKLVRAADWLASLEGRLAIVDGQKGCLYVDPEARLLEDMKKLQKTLREEECLLKKLKGEESITPEGRRIPVCANIGDIRDLPLAQNVGAEGIGLFRSEFLYLGRENCPGEEEQFTVYRKVLEAMDGKRVIVRTMDLGADKQAPFLHLEKEENPALGLRGIRLSLERPELFKTQLRALLRASVYGKLSVLYPMITSEVELDQIQAIVSEVQERLDAEGIPYKRVEQGIMIETPGAVMLSDRLARRVDFFSIGTNDLAQYTLAADRQNRKLGALFQVHHPAVLRMIDQTVQNAHKAGIWCGICGELAADPELTELFLALGVDELSMAPGNVLAVRRKIRETAVEGRSQEIRWRWLEKL